MTIEAFGWSQSSHRKFLEGIAGVHDLELQLSGCTGEQSSRNSTKGFAQTCQGTRMVSVFTDSMERRRHGGVDEEKGKGDRICCLALWGRPSQSTNQRNDRPTENLILFHLSNREVQMRNGKQRTVLWAAMSWQVSTKPDIFSRYHQNQHCLLLTLPSHSL